MNNQGTYRNRLRRDKQTHLHAMLPSFPSSTSAEVTLPKNDPKPNDVEHSWTYTIRHFPAPSSTNDSTTLRETTSGGAY